MVKKYADHIPLYRLSEMFSREEVQITRQILSQWIIRLGAVLFPLYELMLKQIKDSGNAFIDETPVKLQVNSIIDELIKIAKDRLEKGGILPKSKFSKALHYFCGLIPHLKNYIVKPLARIDNNVGERAIRPIAIGHKNWLFVGSLNGGEAASVLLSLVQTCRGLKINPREYLEDIMRRFQGHPANRLEELLPNQWAASQKNEPRVTKPLHQR